MIKQHQTRWLNGKMFGHQTMFDGVWLPNISHLDRPQNGKIIPIAGQQTQLLMKSLISAGTVGDFLKSVFVFL